MREAGTGLSRGKGKSTGKPCRIKQIRANLVFRGADHQCTHNTNEISALQAELDFRDVPGKLVQRRRHSEWFRRLCLRRTLVYPPSDGIARITGAPTRLRLLSAGALTLRVAARALTATYSRIRLEPPAADPAWFLPGLWHRDDPSWSSREARRSGQNAWVIFGEYGWVSFGECRSSGLF